MKIGCFVVCYNEEKILPHFIKHYSMFCEDIYVLDNKSTDRSVDIAKEFGCKIISWSNDTINENKYVELKNNIYKEYRHLYDYIIVCDCDEFIYHENLIEYIKLTNYEVYKCIGYEMCCDDFSYGSSDIKNITVGSRSNSFDKCVLFKSSIDINYSIGAHTCDNVFTESFIELRHMKYINLENVKIRYKEMSNRLSEINKKNGWGYHYSWSDIEIENYYNKIKNSSEILTW